MRDQDSAEEEFGGLALKVTQEEEHSVQKLFPHRRQACLLRRGSEAGISHPCG